MEANLVELPLSASKVRWPELSQLSLCSEFDKENSIEFSLISLLLIHFTTVAMRLLSHGPHVTLVMWHTVTVTICDHLSHQLWHCDKVTWYFPALHLVVVKKRNINNNLAVLPSHDNYYPSDVILQPPTVLFKEKLRSDLSYHCWWLIIARSKEPNYREVTSQRQ